MDPFLGQIGVFSFGFAPKGWALCNGQLMSIAQNQALFALLGTTYGGDGRTTFGLPDLRNSVPMHMGKTPIGTRGGEIAHLLSIPEMASHSHNPLTASSASSNTVIPAGAVLGAANNLYTASSPPPVFLAPDTIGKIGGGQPHDNMQPYLTVSFCIAIVGIFPPRN